MSAALSLDQESKLLEPSVSDPHKSVQVLSSEIIHVSTSRAEALIKMPATLHVVDLSRTQLSQRGGQVNRFCHQCFL